MQPVLADLAWLQGTPHDLRWLLPLPSPVQWAGGSLPLFPVSQLDPSICQSQSILLPWMGSRVGLGAGAGAVQGWQGADPCILHPVSCRCSIRICLYTQRVWLPRVMYVGFGRPSPSPAVHCAPLRAGAAGRGRIQLLDSVQAACPVQIPGAWVNIYLCSCQVGVSHRRGTQPGPLQLLHQLLHPGGRRVPMEPVGACSAHG